METDRGQAPQLDGRKIDHEQKMAGGWNERGAEQVVAGDLLQVGIETGRTAGPDQAAVLRVNSRLAHTLEELPQLVVRLQGEPLLQEWIKMAILPPGLLRRRKVTVLGPGDL